MKIGIFCNKYSPEDGGANSLVSTILQEIEDTNDVGKEFIILYEGSKDTEYKTERNGITHINVNYGHLFSMDFLSRLSRTICVELTFRLDKIVGRENIDIIWFTSPYYTGITKPYIFPVWDLGHLTTNYPEASKWHIKRARNFMYSIMLKRAKYVLTGNETGKEEIISFFHIDGEKVKIAPFPVSKFCFGQSAKPSFCIEESYFFYPAQFWLHKNHITVLKAMKLLKEKYNQCPKMYFTGSDHGTLQFIKKKIVEYGLQSQVVITGFLREEELKYLYENACAMVFASMMGPNNLPPLEAVYLGCPVIITNIKGHKEQMKDLALFFDGNEADDLAEKMNKILTDNNLRDELIMKEKQCHEALSELQYITAIKPLFDMNN